MPAAAATAVTPHTVTPGFAESDPAIATTTIVNNYVTSPVIERIVETRALNTSVLDERIQALRNDMLLRIAQVASPAINFSGPAASTPVSVASFAASQNIDSLTNVTLTNATVNGVAGLTDADVPDSITASNYLPLTGGSLAFASSTLFSVFNNAYFGATATSSFDSAGALTLATPLLVSSGGTGTTTWQTGSIPFFNGTRLTEDNSNLFWDLTNHRLGIGTTTPLAQLNITNAGGGLTSLRLERTGANAGGWSTAITHFGASTKGSIIWTPLVSTSDFFIADANGGYAFSVDTSAGNVGIGNTSPAYKFDVTGAGHFTSYVDAANFVATSSATASIFNGGFLSLASSTIGSGTQAGGLTISGGATTTGNAYFAGNVGIGTASPGHLLTINSGSTPANSQLRLTANNAGSLDLLVYSADDAEILMDANNVGDAYVARHTSASRIAKGGSLLRFDTKGSLTSGNSFTWDAAKMVIDTSGNVGIGSTTPYAKLAVKGAGTGTGVNFQTTNSSDSPLFSILDSGNVGIGTTTPYSRLTVWGPDTAAGTAAFLVANSASTTEFVVYDDGSATLAGTLTQNSDVRLKTNVQSLDASSTLGLIAQLNPVVFHWADPAKSATQQYGFIAQDVQKVFPQLVSTTSPTAQTPDGTLGLNYIGFIAPIVEAIKALMAELHDLSTTVANFAESFTSKQITATNELCVADNASDPQPVCITKSQLAALLSQSAAAGFANPTPAPSQPQDTEPPVITINGNNPATINVGDTYNDLGASITDNVDSNLGIHTYVGTTPMEFSVIDTSEPATYHINYVATDTAGNTATSTRTVIIEAAADSEADNSGDASSPPPDATASASSTNPQTTP